MANSADPDQLASRSQLIWISTVCKGRVYLGSAGQGLSLTILSPAMLSTCDFKSHFCKQCGPISDCSSRNSLIRVNTVCLYAKIGLKSLQEYSADDINRRHFQM